MNSFKNISSWFSIFVLLASVVALPMLQSCADEETEAERVSRLLTSGSWRLQNATVDQTDRTATYQGLQITFSEGSFATTSGRVLWPASGTWQLTDANAKTFDRNDGLRVTINEVDDTRLVLAFVWSRNSIAPGRTQSVSGNHVFTFGK